MESNYLKKYLTSLALSILCISFISAGFGVASQYHETNPLELKQGETIDTYFKIQNTIGNTSDLIVEAILIKGSEIASFTDKSIYEIPASEQKLVNLRIKIPKNAEIGKEYTIEALFKPVSVKKEEGTLQFVINVDRKFQVIVVGDESETREKTKSNLSKMVLIILIISVLVVAMLITYFIRRKKSEKI